MSGPAPYQGTGRGIVTPEAVVLAFETAGVGSRIVAKLLDLAVQAGTFAALAFAFSFLSGTVVGTAGVYFSAFAVVVGYPIGIEALWRGKSVGKAAMGLRVVTVEGAPIRFRHALIRGVLGFVDLYLSGGAVAVFSVLLTARNQRLGDLAAGTLVLRERTGAAAPTAATFAVPPGWEAYAATIDVSQVSATQYQVARAFLLRAPTLDGWTRDRLAREIAGPLAVTVRHTPATGVSAEAFLWCVAARYQQRQRGGWAAVAGRPERTAGRPDAPAPAGGTWGDGGFSVPQ